MPLLWLFVFGIMAACSFYYGFVGDTESCRHFTVVALLSYITYKIESIFIVPGEDE